ncbi:peptidoglycan-binding domain-containing protein [Streptomyces endophytica]|uniref:Peptidoglycan-binding protein n=1 Tax=Streptomyces endophytica TaxID=2991496 RepID=A0ABY6PCN0_9ACTN|nr:peptidoglycan-binding protein [Streptomyces endophytica]UZJ31579.1 peptidoglycan-binding protein [Streptomyces endophytica]
MTALRTCPHCLAPVRSNGRPTCLCAAADADDFDPLRVRPYVSLPEETPPDGTPPDGTRTAYGAGAHDAPGTGSGPAADPGRAAAYGAGPPAGWPADPLEDLPGVDAAVHVANDPPPTPAPASEPLVPRARRPAGPTSRTYRSTPEEPLSGPSPAVPTTPAAASPAGPPPPARPAHRRRALPAALVAAGAAVAATAVLISTDALSGSRQDRAAPPDRGTVSPTAAFPTGGDPSPTRHATPAPPPPDRSPSPAATGIGTPRATVRLSRTAAPPPPAPTRASGSVTDSPGGEDPSSAPTGPIVLREGSSGPEVTELQGRLRQLSLYPGAEDGRYDADVRDAVSRYQRTYGVTGDPDGVYGPRTRQSLEARTQEP